MYIYKTENIKLRWKWFSDKPDEKDIANLDRLINERAAEGWELVTYNTLLTSIQLATAFLVTFRNPIHREKKNEAEQKTNNHDHLCYPLDLCRCGDPAKVE